MWLNAFFCCLEYCCCFHMCYTWNVLQKSMAEPHVGIHKRHFNFWDLWHWYILSCAQSMASHVWVIIVFVLCGEIFYNLFRDVVCVYLHLRGDSILRSKGSNAGRTHIKREKVSDRGGKCERVLEGSWKCQSEEERMFRQWGMRKEMQSGPRQRCNSPICLWCNGEAMGWPGW